MMLLNLVKMNKSELFALIDDLALLPRNDIARQYVDMKELDELSRSRSQASMRALSVRNRSRSVGLDPFDDVFVHQSGSLF